MEGRREKMIRGEWDERMIIKIGKKKKSRGNSAVNLVCRGKDIMKRRRCEKGKEKRLAQRRSEKIKEKEKKEQDKEK